MTFTNAFSVFTYLVVAFHLVGLVYTSVVSRYPLVGKHCWSSCFAWQNNRQNIRLTQLGEPNCQTPEVHRTQVKKHWSKYCYGLLTVEGR